MVQLGQLTGPLVGLTIVVLALLVLVVVATAIAAVEHRWSIGSFRHQRHQREPMALQDEARLLEALHSLVYDPTVWERGSPV